MLRQTDWRIQQYSNPVGTRTPPPRREAPPPPSFQTPGSSPSATITLMSSPLSLERRTDSLDGSPYDHLRVSRPKDTTTSKNSGVCDSEISWKRQLFRRERELEEREEEFHTLLQMQHTAYTKRLEEISRKEKFLMEWEQRLRNAENIKGEHC